MKSVFVPHRVPRSRRPGNFLLNEARLLRIQEVHEADDYRFRPMHASISKFLFSSGLTPRSWAWAEYYEIPPLNFVMGNKSLLLSRFSNSQLQRLPSSLSRFALEGLQRGDIELKAVRAGDVYRDSRGGEIPSHGPRSPPPAPRREALSVCRPIPSSGPPPCKLRGSAETARFHSYEPASAIQPDPSSEGCDNQCQFAASFCFTLWRCRGGVLPEDGPF